MLSSFCAKRTTHLLKTSLKCFARFEGDDLGWDNIKSIKASKWPILKGETTAEKTKLVTSHYLKKRVVNTIPKYFLHVLLLI